MCYTTNDLLFFKKHFDFDFYFLDRIYFREMEFYIYFYIIFHAENRGAETQRGLGDISPQ